MNTHKLFGYLVTSFYSILYHFELFFFIVSLFYDEFINKNGLISGSHSKYLRGRQTLYQKPNLDVQDQTIKNSCL